MVISKRVPGLFGYTKVPCSSGQKTLFTCRINVLFLPVRFQYFCILHKLNSTGISYMKYNWKAETQVDLVSPVGFICDDLSPHGNHFIVLRQFF